jgi:hypothetical protein
MEFNSKDPNRALVKSQYESLFQGHSSEYKKYMKVIQKGMTDLTNQTYVNGGKYYSWHSFFKCSYHELVLTTCHTVAALNPWTHYVYDSSVSVMSDLQYAFEYMTNVGTTAQALLEVDFYERKQGEFGRPLAEKMVYDHNTSPSK